MTKLTREQRIAVIAWGRARIALGTQKDLGRRLGITQQSIAGIIRRYLTLRGIHGHKPLRQEDRLKPNGHHQGP
jgi:hypothetical protein